MYGQERIRCNIPVEITANPPHKTITLNHFSNTPPALALASDTGGVCVVLTACYTFTQQNT